MTRHYCDRCGQEIGYLDKYHTLQLSASHKRGVSHDFPSHFELCLPCTVSVVTVISRTQRGPIGKEYPPSTD